MKKALLALAATLAFTASFAQQPTLSNAISIALQKQSTQQAHYDVSEKSSIRFNMDNTTQQQRDQENQARLNYLNSVNPNYAQQRNAYEVAIQNIIDNQNPNQMTTQAVITIPVVVHVVYSTAAQNIPTNQVLSQIQVLNEDFGRTNADTNAHWSARANTTVQFCLAQQDPSGNISNGIERRSTTVASFSQNDGVKSFASGGLNIWDPTRYLNIWVCNLGGGLLGYGEFPTGSTTTTFGVVILYSAFGSNYTSYGTFPTVTAPYDRGRTTTHEFSHCFNLYHIWGDDGGACTGSDLCADTPNQADATTTCYTFPHTDACTGTGNGIMFENYMDYSYDNCMNLFTNNQKTRILAVLNTAPYNALQTSTACLLPANSPPSALFAATSTSVCPGTPINFTDQSIGSPTSWSWTFPSGTPSTSTAQNPSGITWSTAGTYTVTLVASNANGNSTYTMTITVIGIVNPPLVEGFEAATFAPAGWTNYDAGSNGMVWQRATVGRNSSFSAGFDNYDYNVNGTRDELRTPRINFGSAATVTLTFDVSHRRYSTVSTEQDTLQVVVSTDCGATWTSVYLKGGATLATVTGTQNTLFVPTNTQWRNETVSLNAYAGQGSVMIAFRNRGHYGNAIYVDNVNISTTVSTVPNGAFTSSVTTVCAGTAVSFTDASTNTPTSWSWTFPSGTPASATTQNVASVIWNTAGTYTVTHTATNGSGTGTTTVVITVNARPTVTTTTTGGTICNGSSTTITATGGTSYSWMPGSLTGTTVTVSPTGTTTYTVTGTNANGCTNTATRTITVNPSPTVTTTTTNGTICSGNSTTITGAGGTSYAWMPGSLTGTTITVSPTTTTTYTVTGTGANGCTNTATRTITVNPTPTVTTTTTNGAICNGSNTTITASGATTYSWMPGSLTGTTVTVSPTTTTTYTVTGTSTGCTGTATRTITVNPLPTIGTTTTGATICAGNSTTITGTGGTTYAWMPGSLTGTTVTVTPTITTTYTVTGTNANGCVNTATRTITVNPSPSVSTTTTNGTICSGNSTTITAGGATTYAWMPGSLTGTTVTVSPTTTTTYTVTGTAAGCTGTATQLITVNPTPTVTTTTTGGTICNGSSTTITGNGATTYSWMPGSLTGTTVTVSPTITTTYTVTGTSTGCSGTATRTITVNPLPTISTTTTGATICSGNSTTITGTGGTTYAWMPGSLTGTTVTVTPTITTTYTVTGTGANGCTNTATRTITVNTSPTVNASASSTTICTGNNVTLTGSGASTYAWNPGSLSGASVTITPASTTTYTLTGTAANGCTGTSTIAITVGSQPTVTASVSSPTICSGNNTTLTGSGATTYTWMPGSLTGSSVTVSPATATTYTVTGVVTAGCQNTATVAITVNPTPTVSASSPAATICNGGNTTITAGGAATYNWMPGSLTGTTVTVSPGTSTTYTVTGTAANGCTSTATQAITVNALPSVAASASGSTICNGSNTTLTATGATTYNWMPGSLSGSSVTVAPNTTITYTVTGTDANGCSNTATQSITVNALPTISTMPSSATICDGSGSTITANGATTYNWMPGSLSGSTVSVSPNVTTTYTITGTDASGCVNTITQTINVNALPTVTATSGGAICTGATATLNANGASSYDWMPGNLTGATVTDVPTSSTTYTVTGTDANGCMNTATVAVTVNPLPSVAATATNPSICAGDVATLDATGAVSYDWQPGSLSGATVTDVPASSTTYTMTGTDANGCTNTAMVAVTVNALPTVTASSTTASLCAGGSVTLSAGGASTYDWQPVNLSGDTITDTPASTTTYVATGTDANGCSATASVTVTVNALPTITTSADTTVCEGNPATITANGASSYDWQPGSLSGASQTVTPPTSTSYTVTGTDVNGCTGSSIVNVTVNTPPATPAIIVNGTTLTSTVTGASYQWLLNGNPISGATSQSFTPSQPGTYTVEVYDAIGCASGQSTGVVDPLGITTQDAVQSMTLFPNPSEGSFELRFTVSTADNFVLEIHNALGQVVYREALDNFSGTYDRMIDLSEFGKGVYTVRLISTDKESVIRAVTY